MKKIWNFKIQYTETIIGNAVAETEEIVRENLQKNFGEAPGFEILDVSFEAEMSEEQLELMLEDTTEDQPVNSIN